MDLFLAKKVLGALVLPPTGPLLVALAGLLLMWRRSRWGYALALAGVLALLALSLPVVAHGLLRTLDEGRVVDPARIPEAQAIVVLGGGTRWAAEYGGDTLGRLTLERVRYGALLARKTALPVLVTGGSVFGGTPEAVLMKRALEEEFRVPVTWAETSSRNTHENAKFSAALLRPEGVERILLVGHGFDMPRASAEFSSAGLKVIPAPTLATAGDFTVEHPVDLLPSMHALQASYYALYEMLAEAARRFSRGRAGSRETG